MPLYYFHIRDAQGPMFDLEGIELPHLHAALDEALHTADEIADLPFDLTLEFEIADQTGRTLLRVPLRGPMAHEHSRGAYGVLRQAHRL